MDSFFIHYILQFKAFIYPLIFLGMMVEGETIMFSSFYLAHEGLLNLWLIIPISVIGTLFGDFVWFSIGLWLGNLPIIRHVIDKVKGPLDRGLSKHPQKTLIISKFTYGLHHITLLRARAKNFSRNYFLKVNTVASLIWITILGVLAYISSASIDLIKGVIKYTEVGLLIGFLVLVVVNHFLTRLGKETLEKE